MLVKRERDGPKQLDESVDLEAHADDGPADEDDQDPQEEESGSLPLVLLEKEPECPLVSNDESQPGQEKDLLGRDFGRIIRLLVYVSMAFSDD